MSSGLVSNVSLLAMSLPMDCLVSNVSLLSMSLLMDCLVSNVSLLAMSLLMDYCIASSEHCLIVFAKALLQLR